MYKICCYVPSSNVEAVKDALFAAGAGKIGDYDHCCWQTLGVGQFRPLPGSHPAIGHIGNPEKVEEYKLEMVCADECIKDVVAALHRAHPYETPAYDCWQLAEL